jgi:hypothetical protein
LALFGIFGIHSRGIGLLAGSLGAAWGKAGEGAALDLEARDLARVIAVHEENVAASILPPRASKARVAKGLSA